MVRKRIRRILSGSAVVAIVLFCTLDVNGSFEPTVITHTISGSTGVAGVTMVGLQGEGGQTVVTDQNGYYSATVRYAWSGTVKPAKEGYTFEPASRPYQRVTSDMTTEDYIPTPITYTISGKVTGADSVELVGLPGNPITGPDGSYSVTVPYGWAEMVTPTKEGFTFTPAYKQYPPTKANKTNENYTAATVKLLITGSAQEAGVTMRGLPGNPVTTSNGSFSVKVDYGWTGTITPEKEGYEFQPASLPYNNIITNQTNENFIATALTYVVSGTTGMAGVEMKGLPGIYTDGNGYFTANVKHGFTGTVTPFKEGWKFDPASWMLAQVNSDRTQNFSAEVIKLTISGTTRLPGVEMNGLPGNPVTGADGSYRVTVDYGFTGTVTPIKEGYKFTPESKTYPGITANTVDPPFRGERMTFTISGTAQIAGASIKVMPGGRPVLADQTGAYTATVDYGWTGTITPSKDGYEFMPPSIPFDNVMASQSGQDFLPTLLQRKISGTVRDAKGQPVADVAVVADNNGGQTTTGPAGEFELSVGHGWSGTLTPVKEGYTFRPANKPYARVSADQLNQAFTAIIEMFSVSGAVKLGGVPIDGVLITADDGSGSPITATTDLKGNYSLKLPYGWTGEIIPTKEGIRFNPPSQSLINVTTNIVDGQPVVPAAPPGPSVIPPTPGPTTPDVVVPGPTTPDVVVPGPTTPDVVVP
ncbi:MAG: carboxypeptidase-like regulatory domain-containing protein, partial [Planctomycetota bacterium]